MLRYVDCPQCNQLIMRSPKYTLISNNDIVTYPQMSNQFLPSPQLALPEGAQPRMWHTVTAFSLVPGRTQVTMFGGCPNFERGKSDDAQPKLAETTVLELGE